MVGGRYEGRNDNADLKTILHEGGQTVETVFGNTGSLGARVVIPCSQLADELLVYQPAEVAVGTMNIGETLVNGILPIE